MQHLYIKKKNVQSPMNKQNNDHYHLKEHILLFFFWITKLKCTACRAFISIIQFIIKIYAFIYIMHALLSLFKRDYVQSKR